ncbi:pseudouridine synthase [Hyphomicrobium sp.]|uniref:pseudouridine synthase n=1 Tax=Hyphomicrobium sp. TaxID=82 RepID=UPI003F6FAC6B
MRKTFFGQRPLRGKPTGAKRGAPTGRPGAGDDRRPSGGGRDDGKPRGQGARGGRSEGARGDGGHGKREHTKRDGGGRGEGRSEGRGAPKGAFSQRFSKRPGGRTGAQGDRRDGAPRGERPDTRGQRSEKSGGSGARHPAAKFGFKKRTSQGGGRDRRGQEPLDRGNQKSTRFRTRPAFGSGSTGGARGGGVTGPREERSGRNEQRETRGPKPGGRFGNRGGGSGARPGGSRPYGTHGGPARTGGANDERGERGGPRGAKSGQRFRERPGSGPKRSERHGPDAYAGRGGPPPGVKVRERPEQKGSRYDRMDRPEWTAAKAERPHKGGAGKPRNQPHVPAVAEPMRIAKAMARAGLCSRRDAERWIADGRVSINGEVLKTPGVEVNPKDRVLVDGMPLPVAEPSQLWRYNKPKGLVTTHDDPQGRPTVFDNLPAGLPRVISVGRLDFNTEGLILLTNDGELARHFELPSTGWLRRYRVRAMGRVNQAELDALKEGVEIEGVRYGPVEAAIDTVQGANTWLTVGIREGKNREVRKVLENLGLEVNRLIRISFGPFQLLDLEPGEAEVIKRRVLADQLGPQLAVEFGLVDKSDDKGIGKKKGGGHRPLKAKPKPESQAKPERDGEDD